MEPWMHNWLFRISRKMKGDDLSKSFFFISLGVLVFSVGLYLGREVSIALNQYENLAQSINKFDSQKEAAKEATKEVAVTEQVSVAEKDVPTAIEEKVEPKAEPVAEQKQVETPQVAEEEIAVEVPKVVKQKKVTTVDRTTAAVTTPPAAVDNPAEARYGIQLAAFPNQGAADELVKTMQVKGAEAYITNSVVEGKAIWRVCTGKFHKRAEAMVFRQDLIDKKISKSDVWINPSCIAATEKTNGN